MIVYLITDSKEPTIDNALTTMGAIEGYVDEGKALRMIGMITTDERNESSYTVVPYEIKIDDNGIYYVITDGGLENSMVAMGAVQILVSKSHADKTLTMFCRKDDGNRILPVSLHFVEEKTIKNDDNPQRSLF